MNAGISIKRSELPGNNFDPEANGDHEDPRENARNLRGRGQSKRRRNSSRGK